MKLSVYSILGLSLLLLTMTVEANIFPIVNDDTVCSSKKPCVLKWVDGPEKPSLFDLPKVQIQLMVGTDDNQIVVRELGKVAPTVGKLAYKIPPNLGPAGQFYFYKLSAGVVNVWSSRFTITDIKGKIKGFNPKSVNADDQEVKTPNYGTNDTPSKDNTKDTKNIPSKDNTKDTKDIPSKEETKDTPNKDDGDNSNTTTLDNGKSGDNVKSAASSNILTNLSTIGLSMTAMVVISHLC